MICHSSLSYLNKSIDSFNQLCYNPLSKPVFINIHYYYYLLPFRTLPYRRKAAACKYFLCRLCTLHRHRKYLLSIVQNGDDRMRKWTILQMALTCGSGLFAVLCFCVSWQSSPHLRMLFYIVFVLIPILTSAVLQIHIFRKLCAEYQSALEAWAFSHLRHTEKRLLFPVGKADALNTFAALRSHGIYPCRAGPFPLISPNKK